MQLAVHLISEFVREPQLSPIKALNIANLFLKVGEQFVTKVASVHLRLEEDGVLVHNLVGVEEHAQPVRRAAEPTGAGRRIRSRVSWCSLALAN